MTAEFYNCAVEVMRGAEAIDEYIALPQQEAFDIEYWLLEEAKLKRMPAGEGAGAADHRRRRRRQRHRQGDRASRSRKEGAHIVCVDLNEAAAQATAEGDHRQARAWASAWPAAASPAAARPSASRANITDRASIRAMLDQVALAYGGFDAIAVTAGIFVPARHAAATSPTTSGR